MKMKKMFLGSLAVPVLVLTSCGGGGVRLYDPWELNKESDYYHLRIDGTGYVSDPFTTMYKYDDPNFELDDNPVYYQVNNVKAAVVLVDFEDDKYKAENMPKGETGTIQDLETLVFGEAEETQWHSLASYYDAVSYGKCKVTGIVADSAYHTGMTVEEFGQGSSGSATAELVRSIRLWLKNEKDYDYKDFDANHDGYIDSIIMIYTCPPHVKNAAGAAINDDLFWAYCHSAGSPRGYSLTNPGVDRYFWASYETFFENGYYDDQGVHHDWTREQIESGEATLDAHTLIHEFGHVMSLPDYYNGDYDLHSTDPNAYDPLLSLDMMAYNIGDHNSFSKALYGWTTPYIVSGSGTVTLRSTTDTGDFIIVPINGKYEGTLLSQYLIVEFLTPTGVTVLDKTYRLGGNYPKWFQNPGVRVSLVDARPGMFSGSTFLGFTTSTVSGSNYYIKFACDNNRISRSCYPNLKLIEIVANNKNNSNLVMTRYLKGSEANDDMLFHAGDVFGRGTAFPNYYVHGLDGKWSQPSANRDGEGTRLGMSFKIISMNDEEVKISFSKV